MSLLSLAIQSYDDTVRLYNENLKRKHKALELYIEARRDYERACATDSTFKSLLNEIKHDAALDFVAMSRIAAEGLAAVDHATQQIELVRCLERT